MAWKIRSETARALGAWALVAALAVVLGWDGWRRGSLIRGQKTAAAAPAKPAFRTDSGLESREARQTVAVLARQNSELRREAAELRRQVRNLARDLAAARAEADAGRAEQFRREREAAQAGRPAEAAQLDGLRLLDVSAGLQYAVVGGGAAQGLRPGLLLAVMQSNRAVARVRLVDVRSRISGAVMDERRPGAELRPGDRLVPWREAGP